MKFSHILCAVLMFGPLILEADPAASSEDGRTSLARQSNAGEPAAALTARGPEAATKARAQLARQSGPPHGWIGAATSSLSAGGLRGARSAPQPKSVRVIPATRGAASSGTAARNSTIGGQHAPTSGRLGGPTISRGAHNAILEGTQLRHRF